MPSLLRFAAKPKTLASMAGLAVSGVAVRLVLERLFPGQSHRAVAATTAAATGLLASQGENIKHFVEHLFTGLCAMVDTLA